jgi:citrate synthase
VVAKDTLSVVDNRTGKSYEVPIQDGTVRAADFRQIKVSDADELRPGLHEYRSVS